MDIQKEEDLQKCEKSIQIIDRRGQVPLSEQLFFPTDPACQDSNSKSKSMSHHSAGSAAIAQVTSTIDKKFGDMVEKVADTVELKMEQKFEDWLQKIAKQKKENQQNEEKIARPNENEAHSELTKLKMEFEDFKMKNRIDNLEKQLTISKLSNELTEAKLLNAEERIKKLNNKKTQSSSSSDQEQRNSKKEKKEIKKAEKRIKGKQNLSMQAEQQEEEEESVSDSEELQEKRRSQSQRSLIISLINEKKLSVQDGAKLMKKSTQFVKQLISK